MRAITWQRYTRFLHIAKHGTKTGKGLRSSHGFFPSEGLGAFPQKADKFLLLLRYVKTRPVIPQSEAPIALTITFKSGHWYVCVCTLLKRSRQRRDGDGPTFSKAWDDIKHRGRDFCPEEAAF